MEKGAGALHHAQIKIFVLSVNNKVQRRAADRQLPSSESSPREVRRREARHEPLELKLGVLVVIGEMDITHALARFDGVEHEVGTAALFSASTNALVKR